MPYNGLRAGLFLITTPPPQLLSEVNIILIIPFPFTQEDPGSERKVK